MQRFATSVSTVALSLAYFLSEWLNAPEYDIKPGACIPAPLELTMLACSLDLSICTVWLPSEKAAQSATKMGIPRMAALA